MIRLLTWNCCASVRACALRTHASVNGQVHAVIIEQVRASYSLAFLYLWLGHVRVAEGRLINARFLFSVITHARKQARSHNFCLIARYFVPLTNVRLYVAWYRRRTHAHTHSWYADRQIMRANTEFLCTSKRTHAHTHAQTNGRPCSLQSIDPFGSGQ